VSLRPRWGKSFGVGSLTPAVSWQGKLFPEAEPGQPAAPAAARAALLGGRQQKPRRCHLRGAACWHSVAPASAWQAPTMLGNSYSSPGKGAWAQAGHKSPAACVSLGSDLARAEINGLSV